jgi:hypothetical protein
LTEAEMAAFAVRYVRTALAPARYTGTVPRWP